MTQPIEFTPQSLTGPLRRMRLPRARDLFPTLLLLAILAVAAYLRFVGLNWDDFTHIHPDERFLTMVETSIHFPSSIGEYFNTSISPLNPQNQGYGFFVYGTLPIFLVRYLAQQVMLTGYDQVHLVGRAASAAFDLVSVLLVYLVASRLYRRRVGLLAAAFAAFSVLLIQQSHFFVVDSFANTFILTAFYFAVLVMDEGKLWHYVAFGLMLGMAVASKVSAAPLAGVVVLAVLPRLAAADPVARERELIRAVRGLVVAAVVSVLVFRIFQPYAFAGPSFFSFRLNPKWLANLQEQRAQASGDVDMPPNLQWAGRTPVLFALKNLVLWGLGLPLGVTAWLAWAWALVRILRGQWRRHLMLVLWTGAYFLWFSVQFNPSMRYFLPVYPTLAILAAWGLWEAWDRLGGFRWGRRLSRGAVATVGSVVLVGTAGWAFAFVSIYQRPVTRVEGSRWIYSHLPGIVNMVVNTSSGNLLEPIAAPEDSVLSPGAPFIGDFRNDLDGTVGAILLPRVSDLAPEAGPKKLIAEVLVDPSATPLASGAVELNVPDSEERQVEIRLDQPVEVSGGRNYSLRLSVESGGALAIRDSIAVQVNTNDGPRADPLALDNNTFYLGSGQTRDLNFRSHLEGTATSVLLPYVRTVPLGPAPQGTLQAALYESQGGALMATASVEANQTSAEENILSLQFDHPVPVHPDHTYTLRVSLSGGAGVRMRGSIIVSESTWDDGLPMPVDGFGIGGRYTGVIMELYWQDDQDDNHNGVSDKLERIVNTLSEGDILAITSNRQYGTVPRVPVRYPLTTAFYRLLIGCPAPREVLDCMAVAQPGTVHGQLGYDLVAVFQSDPRIGPIDINDQTAEEAFTVYDHPKVLIFAKSKDFSADKVRALLSSVDLSHVQHLLPSQVGLSLKNLLLGQQGAASKDLMLPPDRLAQQEAGGTWSILYNRLSLINQSQPVAVVAWWLMIGVIGLLAFPLTRAAFPGLRDGGYPLSRGVGLIVVAWGTWLASSAQVPFTPALIAAVLLVMTLISFAFAWRDRQALATYAREHARDIAWVEILALVFFLIDLGIRLGNPDLWHPSKGGEKPMDFSYLNAVLKSTSFPPYDPWFAGGYINYYYYGFVLIGIPIKLIGLIPATAYNIVIPTIFALVALAAYCVGYNLVARVSGMRTSARLAGVAAAVAMVLLGNLGTVRMIYEGFKRIGTPGGETPAAGLAGVAEAARGMGQYLSLEQGMPYGIDEWYWDPSRAIPPGPGEAGPITEFPFFTFLYADLHAHMISRILTVTALAWMLSWLLWAEAGIRRRWPEIGAGLLVGGLAIGGLYPTNLGDYPVYWGLGVVTMIGAALVSYRRRAATGPPEAGAGNGTVRLGAREVRALLEAGIGAVALLALAYFLYQPYHAWYGAGYGSVEPWDGSKTPLDAYLTVHGLFLFILVSWMTWESRQWMASTPISALNRLRPVAGAIVLGLFGSLALTVGLAVGGYPIAIVVVPVVVWAGVLFLRPGMPLEKRIVLAVVAVAVLLTFLVEVVVIRGDISRMNTVFKFYMQVWEMFSVASGAAFIWLLADLSAWSAGWRRLWSAAAAALILGAALYPVTAAQAKIRDRWETSAPHTLDGMAFMQNVTYYDVGGSTNLGEDYRAIQWMQDHIQGSPVIVEANTPEYRWGSRFTIYTGLPGVLGWDWHQRQQRGVAGDQVVTQRALDILGFYLTRSVDDADAFLDRYHVDYVVVGELERMFYASVQPCQPINGGQAVACSLSGYPLGMTNPDVTAAECTPVNGQTGSADLVCPTHGLDKFATMEAQGVLRAVYRDGGTVIYEVVR